MGPIFRQSFVRLIYTFIASAGVYVSLWNKADVTRDRFLARRSPNSSSYDFIVVGGGTAGAVVANRLSEKFNVLLLEAGGTPFPGTRLPAAALGVLNFPEIDWMHRTVPQTNACLALNNLESPWSQGKGLGGSSNINHMIYSRGSPRDYDNWAEIVMDSRWNYESVLPYFKKTENFQGEYRDSGSHGSNGPTPISLPAYLGTGNRFVMAGEEFGYIRKDLNGNDTEGFDHIYYPIRNGRRQGTYSTYIRPALQRPSLTVEKFAHVNKMLVRGENNEVYGVEYTRHGRVKQAMATKEVVLSAGTLNSPKLLMLSGIGPKEHLESLKIPVKRDSPGVGQNLQDHISTLVGPFFVNPRQSFLVERDLRARHFLQYFLTGSGPLSSTGVSSMGLITSESSKLAGVKGWPDLQLMYAGIAVHMHFAQNLDHEINLKRSIGDQYYSHVEGRDSFFISTSLTRPQQRGEVMLRSGDPYDRLIIDPKYLQTEQDVRVLVDGIKTAVELVESTPSFQAVCANFTQDRFPGCENVPFRSDEYWECYARQLTLTLNNYVGTCAMGPSDSKSAVVDSDLRVIGAKNLRVIDASVMPVVPSGNTYAPTLMIGEKGADLIMKEWKDAPASEPSKPQRGGPFRPPLSNFGGSGSSTLKVIEGFFNGRPDVSSVNGMSGFGVTPSRPGSASLDQVLKLLNMSDSGVIDEDAYNILKGLPRPPTSTTPSAPTSKNTLTVSTDSTVDISEEISEGQGHEIIDALKKQLEKDTNEATGGSTTARPGSSLKVPLPSEEAGSFDTDKPLTPPEVSEVHKQNFAPTTSSEETDSSDPSDASKSVDVSLTFQDSTPASNSPDDCLSVFNPRRTKDGQRLCQDGLEPTKTGQNNETDELTSPGGATVSQIKGISENNEDQSVEKAIISVSAEGGGTENEDYRDSNSEAQFKHSDAISNEEGDKSRKGGTSDGESSLASSDDKNRVGDTSAGESSSTSSDDKNKLGDVSNGESSSGGSDDKNRAEETSAGEYSSASSDDKNKIGSVSDGERSLGGSDDKNRIGAINDGESSLASPDDQSATSSATGGDLTLNNQDQIASDMSRPAFTIGGVKSDAEEEVKSFSTSEAPTTKVVDSDETGQTIANFVLTTERSESSRSLDGSIFPSSTDSMTSSSELQDGLNLDSVTTHETAESFPAAEDMKKQGSDVQTGRSQSLVTTSRAVSAVKSSKSESTVSSDQVVSAVETFKSVSAVNRSHTTERQEVSRSEGLGTTENGKGPLDVAGGTDDAASRLRELPSDQLSLTTEGLPSSNIADPALQITDLKSSTVGTDSDNEDQSTDRAELPNPDQIETSDALDVNSTSTTTSGPAAPTDDKNFNILENSNAKNGFESSTSTLNVVGDQPINVNDETAVPPLYTETTESGKWIKVAVVYDQGDHTGTELALELTTSKPSFVNSSTSSFETSLLSTPVEHSSSLKNIPSSSSSVSEEDSQIESSKEINTGDYTNESFESFAAKDETYYYDESTEPKPNEFSVREIIPSQVGPKVEQDVPSSSESAEPGRNNLHNIQDRQHGSRGIDFSKLRKVDLDEIPSGREPATGDQRSLIDLSQIERIIKPRNPHLKVNETIDENGASVETTTGNEINATSNTEPPKNGPLSTVESLMESVTVKNGILEDSEPSATDTTVAEENSIPATNHLKELVSHSQASESEEPQTETKSSTDINQVSSMNLEKEEKSNEILAAERTTTPESMEDAEVPTSTSQLTESNTAVSLDDAMESVVFESEASNHVLHKVPANSLIKIQAPPRNDVPQDVTSTSKNTNATAMSTIDRKSKSIDMVVYDVTSAPEAQAELPTPSSMEKVTSEESQIMSKNTSTDKPSTPITTSTNEQQRNVSTKTMEQNSNFHRQDIAPSTDSPAAVSSTTAKRFRFDDIVNSHAFDDSIQIRVPGVSVNNNIFNEPKNAVHRISSGVPIILTAVMTAMAWLHFFI